MRLVLDAKQLSVEAGFVAEVLKQYPVTAVLSVATADRVICELFGALALTLVIVGAVVSAVAPPPPPPPPQADSKADTITKRGPDKD